jgi:signal transduction histidine kinase
MFDYEGKKLKLVIFSITTVILLILSFLYAELISPSDFGKTTKNFQSVLLRKEKLTDAIISDISKQIESNSTDSLFHESRYIDLSLKEDIIFLVYEDSLLKYWSSNSSEAYNPSLLSTNFNFFSNSWCEVRRKEVTPFLVIGLIRVKNSYPFENQFLENRISEQFHVPENTTISIEKTEYSIFSQEGKFLFSLQYPEKALPNEIQSFVLISLYLTSYIFLIITLILSYSAFGSYFRDKAILALGLIIDVIILRWITFYFQIPRDIYFLQLFKPSIYASSTLFPSLGDLLVNSVTILAIAFIIHKNLNLSKWISQFHQKLKYFISFLLLLLVFVLYYFLNSSLTSIIEDSTISFDLFNITTISIFSIIGLLCFFILILSFIFLSHEILLTLIKIFSVRKYFFLVLLIYSTLYYIVCQKIQSFSGFTVIFLVSYILLYWVFVKPGDNIIRLSWVLFILILFSFLSTYITFHANNNNEKQARQLLSQKLSNQRDFMVEFLFNEISLAVPSDSALKNLLETNALYENANTNKVQEYIRNKYFSRFWDKYDLLITICDSLKELSIQPENYTVNCFEYFDNLISEYGITTNYNNLTFLEINILGDNYIGIIDIPSTQTLKRIYIEVFSKLIPRGLGYPELLVDRKTASTFNLNAYSWARYEENEIIYHFGKYQYATNLANYRQIKKEDNFFDLNSFNHLFGEIDEDSDLILSKKNPGLLDIAAPFSYFFIFYGIIVGIAFIIYRGSFPLKRHSMNFKKRLQWSVISLILFSFIIIGISSVFYIINLNDNKNTDLLSEKSHSVLIELEHKLAMEESLTLEMGQYLSDLMYKLSLVFFSDINLFDLDGKLLATSRQEIITKGLISSQMNPEAFNQLNNYKNSLFIHNESIGDYKYLSAYLPFRNERNKPIAYLNLPYFAKQDDLSQEISTYLVAFINIYVILTSIAILITLIFSNYISKPVQLIKEKIGQIKLGKQNEKIEWVQNDEIGSLVAEYNRMVDELAKSAEQLSRSERESAWREMAKQIAHEIKNPLTPMKLSVQYLKKAWDEKTPDWDQRFSRFTTTLVEQIESLSNIASEFSDFAKMPKSKFEKLELTKVINNAIDLFKDSSQIQFDFRTSEKHFVKADNEQLLRVFINLINNSIQAITDPEKGLIQITIEPSEGFHIIRFSDNGKGIPSDQKSKVFYPNFTTKSGGMGLGLAMVKNIIQNSNGEISFESEAGTGTTFNIKLPVWIE